MIKLAGYVTNIDEWGRIYLRYPEGKDECDTKGKLSRIEIKGTSPLRKEGYVTRPSEKTLYMNAKKKCKPQELMQKNCVLEVEPFAYDYGDKGKGVTLRLLSIQA